MSTELTTPNNSFRYPTASNNGSDFASGLQDFADDADGMWRAGTLAGRPAASSVKAQTVYKATDTSQWFVSDATNWNTLLVAGAWTAITLGSNIATGTGFGSQTTYSAAARQVGDTVQLRGTLQNATGGNLVSTVWATIPVGLRPSVQVQFASAPPSPVVVIAPSGTIEVVGTWGNGTVQGLDGISYSLS